MAVASPKLQNRRFSAGFQGLRAFALLLSLLVVALQPRAFAAGLPHGAASPELAANHAPRAEGHALRVQAAVRVVRGPLADRLPGEPLGFPALAAVRPRLSLLPSRPEAAPACCPLGRTLSHWHSQRRIPRMNSEEPPRP